METEFREELQQSETFLVQEEQQEEQQQQQHPNKNKISASPSPTWAIQCVRRSPITKLTGEFMSIHDRPLCRPDKKLLRCRSHIVDNGFPRHRTGHVRADMFERLASGPQLRVGPLGMDTSDHQRCPDWLKRLSAEHYSSWEKFCAHDVARHGTMTMPPTSDRTDNDDDGANNTRELRDSVGSRSSDWSSGSNHRSTLEEAAHEQESVVVPVCALPGLNMAVNMATLTSNERELFLSLAPTILQDPYVLMDEVVKRRGKMMDGRSQDGTQQLQERLTSHATKDETVVELQPEGLTRAALGSPMSGRQEVKTILEGEYDHDFHVLFQSELCDNNLSGGE
ncbi:uncharacterized protein Z519_12183 [Cladophialophora bantiana CBS 173.52]|uniref:Uncharacterized protein n=1 Tax=Cladophialophora bantiana (strain ATCC 10958 / CBS 173.52 / CDC B-1940 / NIH 8579) TaxID=1442370 RepID=A0A0D2H8R5_CLAB1|nr:uncharacterized protein Z519_12183 [Cladophialophora bantiana CBS 173.52]KIW87280.1 hypothetical protein Z519_12183 [Cladophialophora bantiana CBS 173.52]